MGRLVFIGRKENFSSETKRKREDKDLCFFGGFGSLGKIKNAFSSTAFQEENETQKNPDC